MRGLTWLAGLLAMCAFAGSAEAQTAQFNLRYSSYFSSPSSAVQVNATLTGTFNTQENAYDITGITGTRGTDAITGLDQNAIFQTLYFPAQTNPSGGGGTYSPATYFDQDGITFLAGGSSFTLYRDASNSSFYSEFNNSASSQNVVPVSASNGLAGLSVTAAPEPASWGLMIGGFGLAGGALRRRKATRPLLA